jgi:hypothetical protein
MGSERVTRRAFSLALALSVGLWAQCGLMMLSAANLAAQCHSAMPHSHHAMAAMPCCPSHAASALAPLFDLPCCDMSAQPARPLASAAVPGKFSSGPFGSNGSADTMLIPLQQSSASLPVANSPPFVKPVFDLKTDLRI